MKRWGSGVMALLYFLLRILNCFTEQINNDDDDDDLQASTPAYGERLKTDISCVLCSHTHWPYSGFLMFWDDLTKLIITYADVDRV